MVYNINMGRNPHIARGSKELDGYAYFVHRARYHEAEEKRKGGAMDLDSTIRAIRQAIQDCKNKGLLLEFWNKLTNEEIAMIGAEWDVNIAKEVAREEGREESREEIAKNLKEMGLAPEFISKATGLALNEIAEL